jgi:hypothetical protein
MILASVRQSQTRWLPAGEFVRTVIDAVDQVDPIKEVPGAVSPVGVGDALKDHR